MAPMSSVINWHVEGIDRRHPRAVFARQPPPFGVLPEAPAEPPVGPPPTLLPDTEPVLVGVGRFVRFGFLVMPPEAADALVAESDVPTTDFFAEWVPVMPVSGPVGVPDWAPDWVLGGELGGITGDCARTRPLTPRESASSAMERWIMSFCQSE